MRPFIRLTLSTNMYVLYSKSSFIDPETCAQIYLLPIFQLEIYSSATL